MLAYLAKLLPIHKGLISSHLQPKLKLLLSKSTFAPSLKTVVFD